MGNFSTDSKKEVKIFLPGNLARTHNYGKRKKSGYQISQTWWDRFFISPVGQQQRSAWEQIQLEKIFQ
jgi:hypothetical protein